MYRKSTRELLFSFADSKYCILLFGYRYSNILSEMKSKRKIVTKKCTIEIVKVNQKLQIYYSNTRNCFLPLSSLYRGTPNKKYDFQNSLHFVFSEVQMTLVFKASEGGFSPILICANICSF